jgi:hypothetical protein
MKPSTKRNISGFFSIVLLSTLVLPSLSDSIPTTGAYGKQAMMSPATTSSLNFGGSQPAQADASAQSPYTPGNGVFLTGQPAVLPSTRPTAPQGNGFISPEQSYPMPGGGYGYAPQQHPQMPYGSPYPGQQSAYAPQYGQNPYAVPYQGAPVDPYSAVGQNENTFMTGKPTYGTPPHMVQRNSASYYDNRLPYRNNPNMALNPNSATGPQQEEQNKVSSSVMNILNTRPSQQSFFNRPPALAPASNVASSPAPQGGGNNWLQRVFKTGSSKPSSW